MGRCLCTASTWPPCPSGAPPAQPWCWCPGSAAGPWCGALPGCSSYLPGLSSSFSRDGDDHGVHDDHCDLPAHYGGGGEHCTYQRTNSKQAKWDEES